MPLLNKDKMMNGFGKAVDAVNDTADKAARHAKEHEWDKKIDNMAHSLEKGVGEVGKGFKELFSGK